MRQISYSSKHAFLREIDDNMSCMQGKIITPGPKHGLVRMQDYIKGEKHENPPSVDDEQTPDVIVFKELYRRNE